MLPSLILLAASMSPDYTSVNKTLDDTTAVLVEHCQKEPSACDAMADANMALVKQLEKISK